MMRSLSQLRNEIINMKMELQREDVQHIKFQDGETTIYASDKNKIYIPTSTGKLAHNDSSFVRLIMGPYGSGKSTWAINEIVRRTCNMPRWASGRRKARCIIVRNTSGELQSTTLQTWLAWFGELGSIRKRQKPLLTYEHTFNDGLGIIELELVFIALDRPDDVRKIKSLEATFCYINEMSEVPQAALAHLKGRVNGRYPSKAFCSESYWSGIIADTNPPDEDHWIYKDFELDPISEYKIFKQPSGLLEETYEENNQIFTRFIKDSHGNYIQSLECDNYDHLVHDYYPKLATKQSEGFIKVFCGGKYGIVESGKRVYPEYNDDIHSVPKLDAIQGLPIHLAWDFGLTPACIVFQISPRGQFRVLKEYLAEDMGIRTFAKNVVLPDLPISFPYNKVGESEADPSGEAGSQIMEDMSCIGELNELGIKTNAASTNDPGVRIGSVRYFLNTMIDGQPGFILSREGCHVTRKGFVNGYHFKRLNISGEQRFQEKPNKNKFSHPHDALQYGAMKFAGDRVMASKNDRPTIDNFSNPVMRIF